MQKKTQSDIELQTRKLIPKSDEKGSSPTYQPIENDSQIKQNQLLNDNSDKSEENAEFQHQQQQEVDTHSQLPLKFKILSFFQKQKGSLIKFFDKKTTIIFIIVLILQYISYYTYMWTVYTPSDQNWINYHMLDICIMIHIGIICAYGAMILMWTHKKSKIILGIQIIFVYEMVTTDLGWDLVNHGGWNLAYFLIFSFISFFIIGLYIALIKIWKSGKVGKTIVILIGIIILSWVIQKQKVVATKTKIWKEGFQGMILNNDKGYCKINLNQGAYIDAYDNVIMFWKDLLSEEEECKPRSAAFHIEIQNDKMIVKCPSDSVLFVALPNFELWDKELRRGGKIELSEKIDKYSKKKNIQLHNNYVEIDLSPYTEEGFRVYCNGETLAEQRVFDFTLQNKKPVNEQPLPKSAGTPFNILVVYIDAVSRRNLQRKLPKITEFVNDKKFQTEHNTTLFQMLKFHAVYTSTTDNLKALFSGITSLKTITKEQSKQKRPEFEYTNNASFAPDNLEEQFFGTPDTTFDEENFPTLQKHFRDQGWFTVHVDNSCHDTNMKFLGEVSHWDKEFGMNAVCDIRITNADTIFHGMNSIRERCLDGVKIRQPILKYMKKFLKKYDNSERPWFAWIQFTEAHGPSLDQAHFVDNDVYEFMKNDINYNKTIVVLMSDHGLHMGVWWGCKNSMFIEENRMPFLLFFVPDQVAKEHQDWMQGLQSNEMNFLSHYDLRATLLDMLYYQTGGQNYEPTKAQKARSEKYGNSEFDDFKHFRKGWLQGESMLKPISQERTCTEVGVPQGFCSCNE